LFINLSFQELNGILQDAVVDYKQLVDDMKVAEKERDDLDLKLAEKVWCSCRLLFALYVAEKHYITAGLK
jgi:hypothetical protein